MCTVWCLPVCDGNPNHYLMTQREWWVSEHVIDTLPYHNAHHPSGLLGWCNLGMLCRPG
jgi:hypothetical protein